MKLLLLKSLGELRRLGARWDDLWWRSDVSLPTARAELVAQWVEHFAPRARFAALAVEDAGQLVAALPLVERRKAGVLKVGELPINCWSESGDLLLDPQASQDAALRLLAQGLDRLPWPLLSLDGISVASSRWQAFFRALSARGAALSTRAMSPVGLIDVGDDWAAYVECLSGNHRRAVKKSQRRLAEQGGIEFQQHKPEDADDVQALLEVVCEVEDRSWKGPAGTSILRSPGIFEFFLRQGQQLAEWGQLEILVLTHNGRPIAGEYGYFAKGVSHSHKIGYDEEFRQYGPGRLLRFLQLERYFSDGEYRLVNTLGILDDSKAKWCTRAEPIGRVLAGTSTLGKAALGAFNLAQPLIRRLRPTDEIADVPLGAEGYFNVLHQTAGTSGEPALACSE